jgi:hypothetical protein
MTPSNFLMVGKSRHFSQVDKIEIPPEMMFILATDGVVDLSSENRAGRHESLAEIATGHPVEEIPDLLVEAIDREQGTTDDLVIVTLDPDKIRSCEATILLGGTEETEEKRYRKKCRQDVYEDLYVPIREHSSRRECALTVE